MLRGVLRELDQSWFLTNYVYAWTAQRERLEVEGLMYRYGKHRLVSARDALGLAYRYF